MTKEFMDGLWHRVFTSKYLKNLSVVDWLKGKKFCSRGVSIIWKGFLQTLPWLGRSLAWQVGNGLDVLIGIDQIIGVPSSLSLPTGLRDFLEDLDITSLTHARNTLPGTHHYWYSAEDLCVTGDWKLAWDSFTRDLELSEIRLNTQSDVLIWAYNKRDGSISANLVYDSIVKPLSPPSGSRLLALVWSGSLPKKINCFVWLALRNKILTCDNL